VPVMPTPPPAPVATRAQVQLLVLTRALSVLTPVEFLHDALPGVFQKLSFVP